uniref:Reverse transcriptase domain-containing protein n=1 Tax=Lepisosteus oculatus TaxID=7918 RepID=W5MVX7_LEPOC
EVTTAINKMKSGKATGPDDIPAEVWKLLGTQGAAWLADLFNKITEEKAPPEMWQTSITVPIWKGKGDVNDCSNYRPIWLLCHTMKIFERVLYLAKPMRLCEKLRNNRRHTRSPPTDAHNLIWLALLQHHVPEGFVSWTKLLYQKATSSVRCAAVTSDTFPVNVGIHHVGSVLSPLLFILCMDTVNKDIQTRHPWTLLYADDVMRASETRHSLEQQ